MIKNILFAFFSITILCGQNTFSQSLISGKVVDVIDGRTIVVENLSRKRLNIRLRFLEIPEPEQALAEVVKNHLRELALGKEIIVSGVRLFESRISGISQIEDKTKKVDLTQQMLRDGAGWLDIHDADSSVSNYVNEYREMESAAKNEKRGVWGIPELKTPWDFRSERDSALLQKNQSPISLETTVSEDENDTKSVKSSLARKVDTRPMAIYAFDFKTTETTAGSAISAGNTPSANTSQAALNTNLSQVYFAQFNKGSISTKPYEFTVQNGKQREKITAMFVYDYSIENSSKSIGKISLMFISEIKVQPFLQNKKVSLILDNKSPVNFGAAQYHKTKRADSIVFENIDRNELLSIPDGKSLTLMIGKTKTDISEFKQIIDDFINTLK